jgi:hypothetical protein
MRREDFYSESGLLIVSNGSNGCAGFLTTFELFCAILNTARMRREVDASWAWHNREITDIKHKFATIRNDSEQCLDEIKDIDVILSYEKERNALTHLTERHRELVQRIESNNTEEAKLQERQNGANSRQQDVLEKSKVSEYSLRLLFDDLLFKIGVLSNINSIDKTPRVQVIDEDGSWADWYWSEDNWNDEVAEEWKHAPVELHDAITTNPSQCDDPENTWNNAWKYYPVEEPLMQLQDIFHQRAEEANRVELEFIKIRERYDYELKAYLFHQKGQYHGEEDDEEERQQRLEEKFGPIWLQRCREVSGKMKEVDEAYMQAEQALSDANRRDRETKRGKSEPRRHLLVQRQAVL